MVNLATSLNKFHRNKQKLVPNSDDDRLWLTVQAQREPLLDQGEALLFEQHTVSWSESVAPDLPGIYIVYAQDYEAPLYIGESSSIYKRHKAHSSTTYFSALRRHVGTVTLGFELQTKEGRKRYFHQEEDTEIDGFLRKCHFAYLPVAIGRMELEEAVIKKYRPILNRKDNKG